MKTIQLKNVELENLLASALDVFFHDSVKNLAKEWHVRERKDELIPDYHPCSDEYLFEAFKEKLEDYAFPRAVLGAQLFEMRDYGLKILPILERRVHHVKKFLGPSINALSMVYPENGYIGWHHNGNYPGYNVLFSYSQDGNGNFSYWDYDTKSIQRMQDVPGWNVKAGYYSSQDTERDKVYWHSAQTKNQRISIGFILENETVWKEMLTKISSEI